MHGGELASVFDDARLLDHRRDIGDAADRLVGAEDRGDPLDAIDAVLQGDDAGVRPDQRFGQFRRLLGVPQLDREHHHIDRANRLRIVGDVHLGQMQVAVHALDGEAVLGDGVAMRAARDEENLVSVRRQPAPEIAADRSRRHCRNTHVEFPLSWPG
jgi:hypothetical protein